MTLNILFMSITIKKRKRSFDEYEHDQFVSKEFQENKLKQQSVRLF
ncbi:YrzI family small protein [Rossellomorea vietnamensis]|uniref:YrzI family small protein n=1 Tax=Rossellomorea vietnamensis TaxID=218284 RepID=A0A5D4MHN6_9BACI|nr:YrzI family small protein [Rossellomorea vietnamensis]TYS00834.1 YrzI family small protein [Rossellomorea vietnamensis]